MNSQRKLYQVREWVGSEYSKQLGFKLRCRKSASKLVRVLAKSGRNAFAAPMTISKIGQ